MVVLFLVISQCSASKTGISSKASDLYQGTEHKMVKESVRILSSRAPTYWYIVSAQHGFVPSTRVLEPYDFTFGVTGREGIRNCGESMGLKEKYLELLEDFKAADVVFHVLSFSYLMALGFPLQFPEHPNLVFFGGKGARQEFFPAKLPRNVEYHPISGNRRLAKAQAFQDLLAETSTVQDSLGSVLSGPP